MKNKKPDLRKLDTRLASLYSSNEDKEDTYDRWAASYESDLVEDMDYVAHIHAARIFSQVVKQRHTRVLDVACGTGLVGKELKRQGFHQVDGTDFSAEMLRMSAERGVYQRTFKHDFTQPLEISERYDALICVGLFAFNTPEITDLIHVINTVKPAHYCVVTINGAAWNEMGLKSAVKTEAVKHDFRIEHTIKTGYIDGEGIDGRVLVIKSPEGNRGVT